RSYTTLFRSHRAVADTRAHARPELTSEQHSETLRQRERRGDALREAEGAFEEDDDVRCPREPVERSEEARADRAERGSVRNDRSVYLRDPGFVERDLRRMQFPEQ